MSPLSLFVDLYLAVGAVWTVRLFWGAPNDALNDEECAEFSALTGLPKKWVPLALFAIFVIFWLPIELTLRWEDK